MQDSGAGTEGAAGDVCPRVSVVIPVRNAAATVADTLRSLAQQAFGDYEVIVVDDGSTDNTADIVRSWMQSDRRIRILHQPPSGVSAARNHGLGSARGEWLLFLDGDDWITPDFFAAMLGAARSRPQADIVYCGYRRIPEDGTVMPVGFEPRLEVNPLKYLAVNCEVCVHSLLIRRALMLEAEGFDTGLKTSEDWDLWIRFARMGAQFVGVPMPMALYRIRLGSASSKSVQMARDYQAVVRRSHGPDPRVKRGPQRYSQGWPGRDLERLCVEKTAYLAAIEAANGLPGALAFDTLTTPPDCAPFVPLLARAVFDGLTVGAGFEAAAISDAAESSVREIAARIEKLCTGPPAAERVMRLVADHIFEAQDLAVAKTLWGIHARRLDLGNPRFDFTIPPGVHHLLLRVQSGGNTLDDCYIPVDGAMTKAALGEAILKEIGFALPGARSRLVKALTLAPSFAKMTLKIAVKIWRSKRERKRKLVSFARNLPGTFRGLARFRLTRHAAGGDGPADPASAQQAVARHRAALLGPAAPAEPPRPPLTPLARPGAVPARVPVLMYHRIADDGPKALAEWRVGPARFEAQIRYLVEEGFTGVTSRDLAAAMRGERPLPQRPVMLTFDDAYCDFHDAALPVLRRYDMAAELFVVTEKVGGNADWDRAYGPPAPLMCWDRILEVSKAGIQIGSHLASHRRSTALDNATLIEEGAVSRFTLESKLGQAVTSLALPFGDHDDRVIEAMALCGYELVYTCESAVALTNGDPLRVPRLNVAGDTDLSSFAKMLGPTLAREAVVA